MERALGVGRELVDLLQQRQLLCLQRVAPRAKEVERLSVAEENGLLAFVDDQLRTEVEVLDRVLPDKRFVVTLIFDDAGKAVLFDLLGRDPLGNVIDTVADRAGVGRGSLAGTQANTALRAGKLHSVGLLRQRVDRLMADRAKCLFALGLVEHDHVPTVWTLPPCQFVRAHVDRIAARAVDLLPRKKACLGLRKFPTVGTFNHKFGHICTSFQASASIFSLDFFLLFCFFHDSGFSTNSIHFNSVFSRSLILAFSILSFLFSRQYILFCPVPETEKEPCARALRIA